MRALIVYDSEFGNTEQIARAIGMGLGEAYTVELTSAIQAGTLDPAGVDLLLVGGPTQAHGMRPALRALLDGLRPHALTDVSAATFDTRVHWPRLLSGSAAQVAAKTLQGAGGRLVAPPESFFVDGREGPLSAGELDRATAWARRLAEAQAAIPTG